MKTPRAVLTSLKREPEILIAGHSAPDGDALGSALALAEALDDLGKRTYVYNSDPVPAYYRFLPGYRRCRRSLRAVLAGDPLLVLLDCNSLRRASLEKYSFRRSLVVDHHETESDFGDVRWIERGAAATGLMVFRIIRDLGVRCSAAMATNLYAAISVDTGTFRYSNTTGEVLRAAADLLDAGADRDLVADHLYERWGLKRFQLLLKALDTLEIRDGLAVFHVTTEMFKTTGTRSEDTENFSNIPKMIEQVKVSALLRQTDGGKWKVSLRSKGDVNVAKIAEAFGGGGHRNAAGFRASGDLASVKERLMKARRSIR